MTQLFNTNSKLLNKFIFKKFKTNNNHIIFMLIQLLFIFDFFNTIIHI